MTGKQYECLVLLGIFIKKKFKNVTSYTNVFYEQCSVLFFNMNVLMLRKVR